MASDGASFARVYMQLADFSHDVLDKLLKLPRVRESTDADIEYVEFCTCMRL